MIKVGLLSVIATVTIKSIKTNINTVVKQRSKRKK